MSESLNLNRYVLVLGATSPIARAVATCFAREGWAVALAARDQEENDLLANDLRVRYAVPVMAFDFDALDFDRHGKFVEHCHAEMGDRLEGVVVVFGAMPPQADAQRDWNVAKSILDGNYGACVSLLERFAAYFEKRKSGWICGISSVAGDRGKLSNYIYGSAKAGFSTYLAGLRNRLWHSGVHVLTVKPGPVDTPMTFGMEKLPFLAQPGPVGEQIFHAIMKRKNVLYTPGIWRLIMLILIHVPESIFKKKKM